jgi:hypothetical protein
VFLERFGKVLTKGELAFFGRQAMKRPSDLLFGAWNPIALFTSRYFGAKKAKAALPPNHRKQAEELDQLASTIHTPADARRFVDFLADLFSKETPSAWTRNSLLGLIARAEFSAVSDPQKTIPEPRLAEAWNAYVDTIGAPEDQKVAAAEIHNLRDAFLTAAHIARNRGSRNFWVVPSIYATLPDGRLAPGCRAVESIRVLWDLANMPENIKAARDRASKGVLMSDLYRKPPQSPRSSATGRAMLSAGVRNPYPIDLAQRKYIQLNGNKAFSRAVIAMLTKTLS